MAFQDAAPIDRVAPGRAEAVTVDGFQIAIANVDGSFYAFQHLCPHQGARLGGRALGEDGHITCPRHSSSYDVTTGRCVTPASTDGFDQDLMTFDTRVVDGIIQVAL